MTTDNNFRVKNGLTVGSGLVATDSGSGLGLLGPYIGVISTSTGDIDLYTNNFTADGVEVWLQHNNQVAINTANGAYSWQFKNDGNLTLPNQPDAQFIIGQTAAGIVSATTSSVIYTAGEADFTTIVNGNAWLFDRAGNLQLPNGGLISDSNDYASGLNIIAKGYEDNINLVTVNTSTLAESTWTFTVNGEITFPDLTVQTTAFTGTSIATFLSVTAADTTTTNTATGIVLITDNGNHVAYYNSTVSNWLYVSNDAVVYSAPPSPPSPPPVTDYIAWYEMSSVNISGMTWNDLSGNGYHATLYGSPSIAAVSGGGATLISSALTGSTGESAQFPIEVAYGSTYSLFTVSRWNGATHQRIYTNANNPTWLSGHHSSGAGVAYHGGWVNTDTDWFGTDWVINADQNYFYRPNGSTAAQGTSGSGDNPSGGGGLGINLKAGETSDWATVEVIAYDRTLTSGEIASVESYLAGKYGITLVG